MATGDDTDKKARKILDRLRNVEGQTTYTTRLVNTAVGARALGSGAKATGTVNVDPGGVAEVPGQAQQAPGASASLGRAQGSSESPIDFAIVTSIEIERRAVFSALDLDYQRMVTKYGHTYFRGKLPLPDGACYQIVITQPTGMGSIDVALLDIINQWQPGAVLHVGLAASTKPNEVMLGDVVVSRSVYYYEHSKSMEKGIRLQPGIVPADSSLLQHLVGMAEWDADIPEARPDDRSRKPKVHQGVIAVGERVIAETAARNAIAAGHRKILAVEMEGYSFSLASRLSLDHIRYLDIRGISDDCGARKDDRWHRYAAAAAANFMKHFLLARPVEPRQDADRNHP